MKSINNIYGEVEQAQCLVWSYNKVILIIYPAISAEFQILNMPVLFILMIKLRLLSHHLLSLFSKTIPNTLVQADGMLGIIVN